MKNLLIIGYVWPEPDSSAAGSRMMQLINFFLTEGYDITFASAAAPSSHMADIEAIGVHKTTIELNNSSFDQFVAALNPDIVLFDRFMIEEQFGWRVAQHCPRAIRLLDTEDLHCLRHARHQALKQDRDITTADLNCELAIREVAAILRSDLTLMISSYEISLLQQHYQVSADLLLHLPFMLQANGNITLPTYQDRQGYISIGNFRHAPNWDAVLYLKNTIWPKIRHLQADAQLSVYGAYPPPKATQLHNPKQGFLVKGWADNAHEVMRQTRVCLAPLRFGAGLKGKLIDAMQTGTPSVTTSIGAEAMHGDLPWGGEIDDNPDQFAEKAVQLHQSAEKWHTAQQQGTKILAEQYPRDRLEQRLRNRLEAFSDGLQAHRLNNFIGAMLQHHTLQSTRYMAQWIEAKNKLN